MVTTYAKTPMFPIWAAAASGRSSCQSLFMIYAKPRRLGSTPVTPIPTPQSYTPNMRGLASTSRSVSLNTYIGASRGQTSHVCGLSSIYPAIAARSGDLVTSHYCRSGPFGPSLDDVIDLWEIASLLSIHSVDYIPFLLPCFGSSYASHPD